MARNLFLTVIHLRFFGENLATTFLMETNCLLMKLSVNSFALYFQNSSTSIMRCMPSDAYICFYAVSRRNAPWFWGKSKLRIVTLALYSFYPIPHLPLLPHLIRLSEIFHLKFPRRVADIWIFVALRNRSATAPTSGKDAEKSAVTSPPVSQM